MVSIFRLDQWNRVIIVKEQSSIKKGELKKNLRSR
ncbi:hypothetical protein C8E03_10210 [Lachnotalea glycerini]|uniref:Uncharacterized protein n=1 Tax=Lachnotalea glycerini TaxID=1763509 RepID=A0A318EYL4_9FIRM|nr:hypothetical protein C8E03_10210 [Lachnotalea glycerini]